MDSRQRVLTALNHREPDRVPLDLGGHRASGIHGIAYARLRRYLGLEERPIRIYDPIQQLAIVDEDVQDLFGVDTTQLEWEFLRDPALWRDWTLPDGTPAQLPYWVQPERVDGEWVLRSKSGRVIGRMPPGCFFFEQSYYPFAEGADLDRISEAMEECLWTAIPKPPGPLVAGPEGPRLLRETAKRLRERTDRAVIATFGGQLLELGAFLYRHDNFFLLLAGNSKEAHAFLDRVLALYLPRL
ncbi:MAG: methyltransferase, partial [Anaerolineae bacterium]|nr:methyltransferase [Anaerolineae bacterium]